MPDKQEIPITRLKRSFPTGKWTWIPDRPQDKPPFDWQSRMPVTDAMREFYCEACVAYDNSDGSGDALSFEEVVILQYAIKRISSLDHQLSQEKERWEEHTKHVGRFLTEMYQTMIDPLDEPELSVKIAELCEMLLNQAREDREKLNRSPFNWPADWNKDSSLETWFPLTAEELERIKSENARLTEALRAVEANADFLRKSVGAVHMMISRDDLKELDGEWDATDLPPRLKKYITGLTAA